MRPPTRWTPTTSRLSSKPNRNFSPTARAQTAPATTPTTTAPIGVTEAAGRGDGDQAGDDAGGRAEGGGVSVADPLGGQPAEQAAPVARAC